MIKICVTWVKLFRKPKIDIKDKYKVKFSSYLIRKKITMKIIKKLKKRERLIIIKQNLSQKRFLVSLKSLRKRY